ncbi:hypothetical protein FOH24_02615 [Acetobacter tropicalis]|uniref:Uncharacterized protein n=1 Tax=Acetobacter tropicalis TaxID=104102 RepID=A0A094YJP8_9PROT|nr:hypothetical protein [Acetobacter tropicalis]KAA8391012.1 hypothetical protein FOH22_01340 [Acetobacter tropicalis]KAA8392554.1 hypothetical protein FOH24_02615 [Acetobacter tropicalis]KGB21577.1 hypothetical protein AtDm6_2732 [Acetobacter tropicalis]MBC9009147.1 hypothetical protein [Acetobacter tropicalis]MDO8171823.1 hypothetical protein [Acetobacter tropicalis]
MSLFRSLLDSKLFSAERRDLTKLASQMLLEDGLLQALQKPMMSPAMTLNGKQFIYQPNHL